jgi:hypothetical protein
MKNMEMVVGRDGNEGFGCQTRNTKYAPRITRFKSAAQPIAAQPPTQFPTPLNTIEHDLFTYPPYDPLRSFASLRSLRSFLSHRVFQTKLKHEHNKTQKNTHHLAGSNSASAPLKSELRPCCIPHLRGVLFSKDWHDL